MIPETGRAAPLSFWRFAGLVLVAVSIAAGVFLLWHLREAMMVGFGAVIVAVLLLAINGLLRRVVPVSQTWGVTISALLVLAVVVAFSVLMGSQVRAQFAEVWDRLPLGLQQIEERLGISLLDEDAGGGTPPALPQGAGADARTVPPAPGTSGNPPATVSDGTQDATPQGQDRPGTKAETGAQDESELIQRPSGILSSGLLSQAASWGIPIFNAIIGAIVVFIGGVYLAIDPASYRRGIVRLFPMSQQPLIEETLLDMGRALHLWLIGTLIAMAIVGVLAGLGAWLLGLPAPFALGLFAGLTEFVPIVGPIVGAAPAVLLALAEGGILVVWAVLLYLAIQQVEANMITPLVQHSMLSIAPVVFLLAVVVFGGLFGSLGVIFAAPLAVVSAVAVRRLWMRETLHQQTEVPGEPGAEDQ